MASISKRGSRWFVQVRRKGYPSQSKTFTAKAAATAWANDQESRLDKGIDPSASRILRSVSLQSLIDRYLREVTPRKRGAHEERLRLLKLRKAPVCELPLSELRPAHLARYRDHRLNEVSPATVKRELGIIRHALEVARREWGFAISVNPIDSIAKPTVCGGRDRRLTADEWTALEEQLRRSRNRLLHPAVKLAMETAMRRGELLGLSWSDLNLTLRTASIRHSKTGYSRVIPLTGDAIRLVEGLPRTDRLLFPCRPNALRLAWERAVRRAQIANLRFHDLRHEAISRFFELGLSLPEVALISGHRDPRMLLRYTHLRPVDLARKLQAMEAA